MTILPERCSSLSRRSIAFAFMLLALLPGAAGAQVASGTSAAGLAYEATGSGEAIVLIHAFSMDHRMWAPQIATLEKRFRVIRYDLRGHGKSAGPSAPYAPYEDLRSVLDAVGVSRAILIGLSAGAEIATDFTLAYPDRVTRIVLASPGLGGFVPSTPLTWVGPAFQAAAAGDAERAARLWAATPIMALRNDLAAALVVTDLVTTNARIWSYRTNPVKPLTPPAIKRLSEIACPTLVVIGEQDLPHIKEIGTLLAGGIAGARLATIPRAGHLLSLDAREAFDQVIEEFLTRR
jgi:3-oxoadipate enol-lactonase